METVWRIPVERPNGLGLLLWALAVVGVSGALYHGIILVGSASTGIVERMDELERLEDLESVEAEDGSEAADVRARSSADVAASESHSWTDREHRLLVVGKAVPGFALSLVLVVAAARALVARRASLLRFVLMVAIGWSLLQPPLDWWELRQWEPVLQTQIDEGAALLRDVTGSAESVDFEGSELAPLLSWMAVVFSALAALTKVVFYGFALSYLKREDIMFWLKDPKVRRRRSDNSHEVLA